MELELAKAAVSIATSDAPVGWKLAFFVSVCVGMLILSVMMGKL